MASPSPAPGSDAPSPPPAPRTPSLASLAPHQPNKASRKILALSLLGLMVSFFVLGFKGEVLHPFGDRDGKQYLGRFTQAMVEKTSSPNTLDGKLRYLRKINGGGRFGNKMFEWASTLGVAKRYGLIPCIDAYPSRLAPFVIGKITECPLAEDTEEEDDAVMNRHMFMEKGFSIYADFTTPPDDGRDIFLKGYLISYKYFDPIAKDEVAAAFQLDLDKEKDQAINDFLSPLKERGVTVGIHVRRGDMNEVCNRDGTCSVAGVKFFERALLKMRSEYKKLGREITFVVASDEILWCKDQPYFNSEDIVFTHSGPDYITDFAILKSCDHMIMTIGSFGWWAAWLGPHLNGGTVIYQSDAFDITNDFMRNNMMLDDVYPSSWIPISNGEE